MKVLVLGGGGQVARAVCRSALAQHTVIVKSEAELDITQAGAVERAVREAGIDWIVNGAAYTAVDQAEDDAARATAVNDTAVGFMALAAAHTGCKLLHLSTDFVFDGTSSRGYLPGDAPNPLSVYGATKLGGERQVSLHAKEKGIVLRTAWVYAAAGKNFVLTMLRLMRERETLNVVADQVGSPTWATSIAGAIWGLIDKDAAGGIYHWTDLGVASWYDFAVAIQEEALARGLLERAITIVPIASAEYPAKAARPNFSVLNTDATRRLLGMPGRHWRTHLRMMLGEL